MHSQISCMFSEETSKVFVCVLCIAQFLLTHGEAPGGRPHGNVDPHCWTT